MYGESITERFVKIAIDVSIADALGISLEKYKVLKEQMIEKSHMKHEIAFLKTENKKLKKKLEKYEPKATKYRKKPLVIEAVIYESIDQIKRYFPNIEYYPCKVDIFEESYERV